MENSTNAADFIAGLKEIGFTFSGDFTEEMVASAPAGLNSDAGTAFAGALASHCILTYQIASRLSKMISGTFHIDEVSLKKVCYLHQIAKAVMMIPNDNQWEIEKRGLAFKFAKLPGCLKVGERSILIASNAGIKFTPEEYEAMKVLDRDGEDYKNSKFNLSILSIVLNQANELAYAIEKERNK